MSEEPIAGAAPSKTVLIVDDEEQIRLLVARTLQSAGYRVLTASDGVQALQVLAHTIDPVDLLVTDLKMPGMSGEQLADRVRQRPPYPRLLFMSGFQSPDQALSLPGPFLPKPFSSEDLLSQVERLLQ